ncbi:MAG: two-component regulator propeller domain-containing protein, partial [Ardenticatenaceae bacterium]
VGAPPTTRWLATVEGAGLLGVDDAFTLSPLQGTEVYAIHEDRAGALYFGAALGLFYFQPGTGEWYRYAGTERTEQVGDWALFTGTLPAEEEVALPPVRAVLRGPDASLWIGTEQGIARYRARAASGRGLTYETLLEAYPDLTTERVFTIRQDQRGLLWFGTARGLFRYDGRDWWHHTAEGWRRLGQADSIYAQPDRPRARGAWFFRRATDQWLRFDEVAPVPLRTTEEPPVTAIYWLDELVAERGTWDGKTFTGTETIPPGDFSVRFKPQEERIVAGGVPALPRLPVGSSTWRYLSTEPEALVPPADLPFWSTEGRLFPPPPVEEAPAEGRYDVVAPPPPGNFEESVFAYDPVVRIHLHWEAQRPLTVLARLHKRNPTEEIDPAILDRIWQGMQQVRPAGVRVMLAVGEEIVRSGLE